MLIPISDDNPTRRFPLVTIALVAANVLVFAYEASMAPPVFERWILAHAFIPAHFAAAPLSLAQWQTVFASMFMHGGWLHVGGNMLYLWIFGNNIEDRLGSVRFLGFYLVSGVAAMMAQFLAGPAIDVPNLGASGAVAGVLGAYLLLYPRAPVLTIIPIFFIFTIERLSAFFVIGFWFVLQLLSGFLALSGGVAQGGGGIAWFAHIGGFVTGMLLIAPSWLNDRRARGDLYRGRGGY